MALDIEWTRIELRMKATRLMDRSITHAPKLVEIGSAQLRVLRKELA
jgi:hypothetical protein